MSVSDSVIVVDAEDREIGVADKLAAHAEGVMHRAFSVFLFDGQGRLLLQRRAPTKYHSGGLWSNTCCSHPRPGESVVDAAARRMPEELGIRADLRQAFSFIYRADFENGLIEHELDHVLIGRSETVEPTPDPREVDAWKWATTEQVRSDLAFDPHRFTVWFRLCFERAVTHAAL